MSDQPSINEPTVPDQVWDFMQESLGYSDEEMVKFRENPNAARIVASVPEMMGKTIVFEVVESHGCASGHGVGAKFYFSADGNLIPKMAPKKVCAFALPVMTQAIYGIQELIYAGIDPNTLCFKRGACFDVGVQCGGWGRVVVEASVMERSAAKDLWTRERTD